ncbi:MAG TPA: PrpF domain-containing protein [Ktedonobacteraceae bacterium]|nr:PrpF domain-containing protein [Ktedonobacteraceae bacterium]
MQARIRTVIMRGGTSRGIFFRDEDLPVDSEARTWTILAAFGSPDRYGRQIDGLGGATSLTSKAAIISKGTQPGIDINFTFGQVSIEKPLIDMRGNCGNISAAVGPYAIDEGLVPCQEPVTQVRFLNTNTQKVIVAHVPTRNGRFEPEGEYAIAGVPGTGSKIVLDFLDPGGSVTGKLFPTGQVRDILHVPGIGHIEVSIVDAANPLVFCRCEDFGLSGQETPEQIDANQKLLQRIGVTRAAAAVAIGLAGSIEEAIRSVPSVPKIAFVTRSRPYLQLDGVLREAADVDLVARIMSMGHLHRAYALTGAICTTVAAQIPGTLVYDVVSERVRASGMLRLGHPSGVMDLSANLHKEGESWHVEKASATRTARRLMEGDIYIPIFSSVAHTTSRG